ncbi:MAG: hypothetical protein CVU12_10295 [Bacteroidetes bacterium HGW-Bacteroidetes-7]|jgi:hypothetical protein|nr:MAG: hypothetical protein CVU12_10295 [Bacteroidetes bacterium HGW-Bacteroidetes-7]
MKKLIFYLVFVFTLSCSKDNSNIIIVNTIKNYPLLDLKLSDVADITYIPLKFNKDSIMFINDDISKNIYVSKDKIIIGDRNRIDSKLFVYDHRGNLLYQIGRRGRGPGEFLDFFLFTADTISNEVVIYNRNNLSFMIYDINGNHKYDKQLLKGNSDFYQIENIGSDYIIGYNYRSSYIAPNVSKNPLGVDVIKGNGKSLVAFERKSLSIREIKDIYYSRPYISDNMPGLIWQMTTTSNGTYITSFRCDTIFLVGKDLSVTPKFVDVTEYGHEEITIFPTMETTKYVFFSTEMKYGKSGKLRHFAYDKSSNSIFRINNNASEDINKCNFRLALISNEIVLNQFTLTQNHNYAAILLTPVFLKKHYELLNNDLKTISDRLREDDNPVLMLMKFR